MNIPSRPPAEVDNAVEAGSGDWSALAADWRTQPLMAIDPDVLRRDVVRRGRWLRAWLALEIMLSVVALGLCAWATWWVQPSLFSPPALLAVAASVIGFQGWSLWIRRRQIRDIGLDARALLALERERIDTSIHYWRVNAWVMAVLWVALFGLLMAAAAMPVGAEGVPLTAGQAALALAINAPLVVAVAVLAWWLCRRGRERRERVVALQAELDSD